MRGSPSPQEIRTLVSRRLETVNFPPMDYDAPPQTGSEFLPTDCEKQNKGLLDHFFLYALQDSLGSIAMLWQDYAATKTAGCEQCLELAKLHSTAVDFAKSGCPAVVPRGLRWEGTYAHWRERKDTESHHCDSIIGRLYDDVLGREEVGFNRKCHLAICGRDFNKYGQLLSTRGKQWSREKVEKVFDGRIPHALDLQLSGDPDDLTSHLLWFAEDQRGLYEEEVAAVMNKFHLRNEGELFTGCLRKFHKFDKKRQNAVVEEVRNQCRTIRNDFRTAFFREVLDLTRDMADAEDQGIKTQLGDSSDETSETEETTASDASDEEDYEPERLQWAEKAATSPEIKDDDLSQTAVVRKVARMLAAAYYTVTYSVDLAAADGLVLFSFPWIVADVIACGLKDSSSHVSH
jgi:hypothetical protein